MTIRRALFVIGSLRTGGAEGQLVELLRAAHPDRIEAQIATLEADADPEYARALHEAGVTRVALAPAGAGRARKGATSLIRLTRLARAERPDAICAWLEESSLLAAPVARLLRIPLVVGRFSTVGALLEASRPMSRAIRRAERSATIVTTNSSAVMETAVERGIARERLRLVPNGLSVSPPLPLPNGGTVALGYLARFAPQKGQMRLLDVAERIRAKRPWRIDLAGDGAMAISVHQEIKRRGLDERVRMVGHVPDIREFWAEHDIAVLLSDPEGSPLGLIEAAMAGRPMIASDAGGAPDIVAPDGGLLVRVDDSAACAAALSQLIDNAELREQMSESAHRQAVERFSVDRFVTGHLKTIEEAIAAVRTSFGKLRDDC